MRDHDEVFRRVMKAKEQYEQQKKEKTMYKIMKNASGGGASDGGPGKSSKAFVWAMRVVAAALVCVAIIGGIVAGVHFKAKNSNAKSANGEGTPTGQVTNAPTESVTPTPFAGSAVLTLWSAADEGSYAGPAFEQAIAEMRVRYPNIDLRVVAENEMELGERIKAAVQEGTLPDIFYVTSGYVFDELVSDGQVYCIDNVYANYADALPEAVCGSTSVNGKKYAVPYTITADVLYVNMDVLRKVGIYEIPATYEDLIRCCDTLRQNGVVPFGCAGGLDSEWCLSEFVEQLFLKNAGVSALEDIYRGTGSWQNPDIAEAIDIFKEFVRKGYFSPDDAQESRDNAEILHDFMDSQYAFYVGGSWNSPQFATCGKDIVVAEFPVINSTKAGNGQFLCGTTAALAVSNNSGQKELAARYAMELGQLVSRHIYQSGESLPAWRVNYAEDGVDALTVSVAEKTRQARDFVVYAERWMDSHTLEKYKKLIRKVYNGEIDGAAFTAAMEATRAQ